MGGRRETKVEALCPRPKARSGAGQTGPRSSPGQNSTCSGGADTDEASTFRSGSGSAAGQADTCAHAGPAAGPAGHRTVRNTFRSTGQSCSRIEAGTTADDAATVQSATRSSRR